MNTPKANCARINTCTEGIQISILFIRSALINQISYARDAWLAGSSGQLLVSLEEKCAANNQIVRNIQAGYTYDGLDGMFAAGYFNAEAI